MEMDWKMECGEIKSRIQEYLGLANDFIKQMNVGDIAILKFCLLSMGMLVGICLPRKWKRPVLYTSLCVFVVTYLPLLTKWGMFLGNSYCQLKKEME